MTSIVKRTVSLSSEQEKFITAQLQSGGYTSASEVVRAGLRVLQERDKAVEHWLREQVAPVYDAMQADPSRAIAAKEAFVTAKQAHQATQLTD